VQSADDANLTHLVAQSVTFKDQLPQVRFAGTGVIVPTTQGTTVPIETMNLRAVIVEAFQIYGDDMTQFLQVNSLSDSRSSTGGQGGVAPGGAPQFSLMTRRTPGSATAWT